MHEAKKSHRALIREAWHAGVFARANNEAVTKNPHRPKSKEWFNWRRGYWQFDIEKKRKQAHEHEASSSHT
jgi:hypothetical protein